MNWWVVVLERQTGDWILTVAVERNLDFRGSAKLMDWFIPSQQNCGANPRSGGVQYQPVADRRTHDCSVLCNCQVSWTRTAHVPTLTRPDQAWCNHRSHVSDLPRAVVGAIRPMRISGIPIWCMTMRIWCSYASLWSPTCTAEPDRGRCCHQLIRLSRTINFTSGWLIKRLVDRIVQLKLIRHAHYLAGITNAQPLRV